MDLYMWVKYVHVLSATVLFGTGIGTAFAMIAAHLRARHQPAVLATVAENVVLADWLFTLPAVIVQPVTGAVLMWLVGYPLTSGWIRRIADPVRADRGMLAAGGLDPGPDGQARPHGRRYRSAPAAPLPPAVPLVVCSGLARVHGGVAHLLADALQAGSVLTVPATGLTASAQSAAC
jgi:Predicted integral membrane protein (DUF2269)